MALNKYKNSPSQIKNFFCAKKEELQKFLPNQMKILDKFFYPKNFLLDTLILL
jgi:hypothetical protein